MTQDEFYEKIPEWISKPEASWNHITLMAYFCHKYTEANGVRFRLVKWNSDPGKGKESRDFSKIFKTFAPEGYSGLTFEDKRFVKKEIIVKIYNYINWDGSILNINIAEYRKKSLQNFIVTYGQTLMAWLN